MIIIIKVNLIKENEKTSRRETLKLGLSISLFFLVFFSFSDESFSLTDYQIKRFCAKEKKVSLCVKNLQEKRSDLQEGKLIEIPVKPYRR